MSNGQQIGAWVGAVVGTVIGFFVGMPQLGFAVGWMAGSWIGGAVDPPPDQISDMGAQEFPPFNKSIRGLVLPVIFGTNRVGSQIVWQGNNETVRNTSEATSAGGKGGGSGAKGPKQVNANYTYKLDLIYHLGMVREEVNLLRGWIGGQPVDSNVIAGINQQHTDGFTSASPLNTGEGQPSLNFDSAIFFPGNLPETASWSTLTDSVGYAVRWPGTCWVGFDGLNLGESPQVPNISWEIGPTPEGEGFTIDTSASAGFEWEATANLPTTGVWGNPNKCLDQHGNYWLCQEAGLNIKCYDFETGANLVNSAWGTLAAAADAALGTSVLSGAGTFIRMALLVAPHLERIVICADASYSGAVGRRAWFSGKPLADGSIEWKGSALQATDVTNRVPSSGWWAFDISAEKTISDPLILAGDNSTTQSNIYVGPSIAQMEGAFKGQTITEHRYTMASPYGGNLAAAAGRSGPLNSNHGLIAFCVPETDNGLSYSTKVLMYGNLGFGVYESSSSANSYLSTTWNGLYGSTGGMIQIQLGNVALAAPAIGTTRTQTTGTVLEPFDDCFIDSNGALYSYFDDDGKDYDTATTSNYTTYGIYTSAPFMEYVTEGGGGWLTIFHYPYIGGYTGSEYQVRTRVRAYFWDPLAKVFIEYAKVKGGLWFAVADTGYTIVDRAVDIIDLYWILNADMTLDCIIQTGPATGGDQNLGCIVRSNFGTLTYNEGDSDITPPEIIYEILVNPRFGLYPGKTTIIHNTSYQQAITYCENNDIKVSCTYARAEKSGEIIKYLLALYGGWLSIDATAGTIKFGVMDLQNNSVRVIDNDHLVRKDPDQPPVITTKGARQDTINYVKVQWIDRRLDYNTNYIEDGDEYDQDLNGIRAKEFPPNFVFKDEAIGWKMIERTLWTNLYQRDTHQFYLGWKDADLEPGDCITLVDSFSDLFQVVQITRWVEEERGLFKVAASQQLPMIPGRLVTSIGSADWRAINESYIQSSYALVSSPANINNLGGPSALAWQTAYELPAEFEPSTAGRVYVAWAGNGKSAGARLWVSADGNTFAPVLDAIPYVVHGTLLTGLPAGDAAVTERVEVLLHPSSGWTANSPSYLFNATMMDVSVAAMHYGAGTMMVGSEMLAFEGITLVAQNRYRLDRVYRGWGGTPRLAHNSGDTWFRHGAGVFAREYTSDQIGTSFVYKVTPYGFNGVEVNVASVNPSSYQIRGTYHAPPPATALDWNTSRGSTRVNVGSEIDIDISWRRGARLGGFGRGGAGNNAGGFGGFTTDVASPGWRINVVGSGNAIVRSLYTDVACYRYTNSQNFSDNGAWRGNVAFVVTPINPYGEAPASSVLSCGFFF